jgi:hypothetical protein
MSVQQKQKGKKRKRTKESKVNACDVGTEKKQRKTKGKNTEYG